MTGTQQPQEQIPSTGPTAKTAERSCSSFSSSQQTLASIAALGLLISFFVPWITFLGTKISGLDIQKNFSSYQFVWVLPLFAVIALVANFLNKHVALACRVGGAVPFCILAYSMNQLGIDVWKSLLPGAWMALASGLILAWVPDRMKKQNNA